MRQTKPRLTPIGIVEEETTLLPYLLGHVSGKSRNNIKSMLSGGQFRVNGKTYTRFDHPLTPGDKVGIAPKQEKPDVELPFPILYEDRDIIVIDKPAGLLTIATEKEKLHTAYHILTDYVREKDKNGRIFVVHRLDRDTSGIVLFAKNEETKLAFQENWDERVRRRGYRALVEGVPEKTKDRIVSYLLETRTHLVYSGPAGPHAKEAITRYEVISSGGGYALLDVDLETGRKTRFACTCPISDILLPVTGSTVPRPVHYPGYACMHMS